MARGMTERYMTKEVLIGGFLEEIMPKERYKVKKVNHFQSQEIKVYAVVAMFSKLLYSEQTAFSGREAGVNMMMAGGKKKHLR